MHRSGLVSHRLGRRSLWEGLEKLRNWLQMQGFQRKTDGDFLGMAALGMQTGENCLSEVERECFDAGTEIGAASDQYVASGNDYSTVGACFGTDGAALGTETLLLRQNYGSAWAFLSRRLCSSYK